MIIGVLKESNDKRVAVVPTTLDKIKKTEAKVWIEKGAGNLASFPDSDYAEKAEIKSRTEILENADILISVNPPDDATMNAAKKDAVLISSFEPYNKPDVVDQIKAANCRAFSMDMIPRTTLAQSMDILSSMAAIAGYKAVLTAANHLDRYFPMMITAAGSIKPSKVLILGAGVAGLQAIATAKRLGAMVEAFDVRAAAKEEVESLGAKFVEVAGATDDTSAGGYAVEQTDEFKKRQQEEVQKRASAADVVITTAQLRGRKAPILLPKETVEKMKKGSVIVDLAASTGGNCELSENDKIINHNGITIIGDSALPKDLAEDASTLISNNMSNFLNYIIKDGAINFDMEDEIIGGSYITK